MDNGDGIVVGWLGYVIFIDKNGCEFFVCCMLIFFEIFLVIFIDSDGVVCVDVLFCCVEFKYLIE